MSTIAFFSSKQELEILEKREDFSSISLIALTPEADFCGKDYNPSIKSIEDFYDEKELNIVGNNSLEKVNEICHALDSRFFRSMKFFSCSDIYMFIKVLYDQLLINHYICKGIFEKEAPQKIILFNKNTLNHEIMTDHNDDLLIHFIYDFFHEKNHLNCENIECLDVKLKKTFPILQRARHFISGTKFKLTSKIKRFLNRRKPAILIAQHHDFEICKKLQDIYKVYWLRHLTVDTKLHSLQKHISIFDSSFLHDFFSFDEKCYFNVIKSKINFLINSFSVKFETNSYKISDFLMNKKIQIVISASGQSMEVLETIKSAHVNNIPVIWGQHGGLYGYGDFPILRYLHQNYTHYFLYTKSISNINNDENCYPVSDLKLLNLYHTVRGKKPCYKK